MGDQDVFERYSTYLRQAQLQHVACSRPPPACHDCRHHSTDVHHRPFFAKWQPGRDNEGDSEYLSHERLWTKHATLHISAVQEGLELGQARHCSEWCPHGEARRDHDDETMT